MRRKVWEQIKLGYQLGKKSLAVLIDPDKIGGERELIALLELGELHDVDYFFVGGSLITTNNFAQIVSTIKSNTMIPVVLFPGSNMQIDSSADAVLFLSLISGRNPDLLIGQHVVAAPILKKLDIEILPTGYILVNAGNQTTVSYMSNTQPIPYDKSSVAACTAMAGEMLGLQLMYLDAGSGAHQPISNKMISVVRKSVNTPMIVGGGINTVKKAENVLQAGADIIVIGNAIEENPSLIGDVTKKIKEMNEGLNVHK